MKKKRTWTALILIAALILIFAAPANCEAEDARILLMRCYQQDRSGVCSEAVLLDEEGCVWQYQSDDPLPDTDEERLAFLAECQNVTLVRRLDVNRVLELESLIAEFRLQKVRKNLGDQLSGGERRRTEIARCLAIDPKFIMLDEPFAGVDPIAVQDIQSIVAKLKHKNIGILITDHNVYETLSICDRAYLLFEGKVLFQGTAEQLAENEIVREKYLGKDFVLRKKDF